EFRRVLFRSHRRRGEGTRALPPRPARLALRSPLALLLAGIFVASDAGLAANDRAGVVATPLCRLCRYLPLKGGDRQVAGLAAFLRAVGFRGAFGQGGGCRFFRAADGHFVERVAAEEGFCRVGARAHVVERRFGEV